MPSKALKDSRLDNAPDVLNPEDIGLSHAPETLDPTEVPGLSQSVTVDQEMPDELSAYHRFVVKNFANSPQAAIGYLKERYPDSEIVHDKDNILMRKPGEKHYKTLDPSKPWAERLSDPVGALKEGAMDLGDIAYDIPAGVASTAASAAAGVAGGAASAGPGAIPSAMAAGGATSAGLEGLRQKLGSILGIPQEVSGKDVALSGVVGAAAPLLFGTGASGKMVANEALKRGLTQQAGQDLLNSQSGAVGRALPYVGQGLSGIPADRIRTAMNRLPELEAMEKEGVTDVVSSAKDNVGSTLRKARQATGKQLQDAIEGAGEKVDISEAKAHLVDHLNDLKSQYKELSNPALKDEIDLVEENIKNIFKGEGTTPIMKQATDPITGAKMLVDSGERAAKDIPDQVSAATAFKLQDQLRELANLRKTTGGITARNSKSPVATQQLENKARDAYDALNNEFDRVTTKVGESTGQSTQLKAKYQEMKQIEKALSGAFKDDNSAYNALRNLGKVEKRMLFETLKKVDAAHGTSTVSDSELIDAFLKLGKNNGKSFTDLMKSPPPASTMGATLGAYEGSKDGGGWGGGIAGAAMGGGAGMLLGSPTMMRGAIGAQGIGTPIRSAVMPTWNMIDTYLQQNKKETK